jgi:hypothetical protein
MDADTVGAVAALRGVSARTLHHCDHIGLVVPSNLGWHSSFTTSCWLAA